MKQISLIGLLVASLVSSTLAASNGGHSGHPCKEHQVSFGGINKTDGTTTPGRLVKRDASLEGGEFPVGALLKPQEEQKSNKDVIGEFVKLMLNPLELAKKIAATFKLDFEKLTGVVGKGMLYGLEAALAPVVVSGQLVEKVFVPNACALKFSCSMGAHLVFMKPHVLKLSSKILDGSKYVKAFGDGIIGRDCEAAYSSCTNNLLTVRKSIKDEAGLSGLEGGSEQTGDDVLANLVGQQYGRNNPTGQNLLDALRSSS